LSKKEVVKMRMMLSNEAPDGGTSLSLASPFFGLQRLAVMLPPIIDGVRGCLIRDLRRKIGDTVKLASD
jgi:hypothetical protein